MRLPFHLVIDFAHTNPKIAQAAFQQFFQEAGVPTPAQEEDAFPLFAEWLIFDFRQPNGLTFLTEYCLKNPNSLDGQTLAQLVQGAESHWYGAFEIVDVKRGEWLVLKHLFSGKKIRVYDETSSASIPQEGTVYARIGKVDGEWYFVGANPLFAPLTSTERMKKMFRKKKISYALSTKDTWKLISQPKQPSPPVLTGRALEEKRRVLTKQYEDLAKRYAIAFPFKKLLSVIYKEDRQSPLDIWEQLMRKGLPEKVFFEHSEFFQDIWNYFPHRVLGSKSPIEMFQELKAEKKAK